MPCLLGVYIGQRGHNRIKSKRIVYGTVIQQIGTTLEVAALEQNLGFLNANFNLNGTLLKLSTRQCTAICVSRGFNVVILKDSLTYNGRVIYHLLVIPSAINLMQTYTLRAIHDFLPPIQSPTLFVSCRCMAKYHLVSRNKIEEIIYGGIATTHGKLLAPDKTIFSLMFIHVPLKSFVN